MVSSNTEKKRHNAIAHAAFAFVLLKTMLRSPFSSS